MTEAFVGQLVAVAAPVEDGEDKAAVTQAGQEVRRPSAGDPERVGEIGRIGRSFTQGGQELAADRSAGARPNRARTSMSEATASTAHAILSSGNLELNRRVKNDDLPCTAPVVITTAYPEPLSC